MSTHYIQLEADSRPTFGVEIEAEGDTPTEGEISDAVEALAQQITFEGYMAEFAEDVGWHILGEGATPKPRVLVIRDPDASNDFVVEGGDVEIHDLDLGALDLGAWEDFAFWATDHLAYAAELPEGSTVRDRIENVVSSTFGQHEQALRRTYKIASRTRYAAELQGDEAYSLPEVSSIADLRDLVRRWAEA